jgi:hypothetical protein
VRPDVSGRYVFAALPPGTYRLCALTDLEPDDVNDRQFLSALLGAAITISVEPGEHKVQNLRIGR